VPGPASANRLIRRLRNVAGRLTPRHGAGLGQVCSGGYLGFDPDDNPVVWTPAEYAAKPGWGAAPRNLPHVRHSPGGRHRGVGCLRLALSHLTHFVSTLGQTDDPAASGSHLAPMLQDLMNGRPTKIACLNGAIAARAAKHSVNAPVNTLITRIVTLLESTWPRVNSLH
jgi:hypothetical protein